MSIRTRLTAAIVLITTVMTISGILIVAGIATRTIEDQSRNALRVLATTFKNTYEDFLHSHRQLLSNAARNPDLTAALDKNSILNVLAERVAIADLRNLREDNPQIVAAYLTKNGAVALESSPDARDYDLLDFVLFGGTGGNALIKLSAPLETPEFSSDSENTRIPGRPDSELVIYLDLGHLVNSRLHDMRFNPQASFYLYDAISRNLILHTDEQVIRLTQGRVNQNEVDRMLGTTGDFFDYWVGQVEKTGYLIRDGDLVFAASLPRSEIYGTVITLVRIALLLILFELTVSVVIGYFMSRSLTNPLMRLKTAAESLRDHNYATRIQNDGKDEIAGLASTFNLMAEEIQTYTSDLEVLVQERTRQLVEKMEQIERLSRTDALTGLYNRAYFQAVIEQELVRSRRTGQGFGLIFFDLDHFKEINDRYGHVAGDKVLVHLSRLVSSRIRESDTLARWGGEEFALILPFTDLGGTVNLADSLRKELQESPLDGVGTCTSSFGCTIWLADDDADSIMSRVDKGLYQAKQSGRNCVRFV